MLQDINLPIRIHQIPFLVVDQEMDEVLLGRPLLKKLGFDLKSHLDTVGISLHGRSFDELNEADVKMSKISYNGMRYDSVGDDPIELPEGAGAHIGVDKREEIDLAFNQIVEDAEQNGISNTGKSRLRRILERFREAFRIQL